MEQIKNYKKTLKGAVGCTLSAVLLLIVMIRSNDGDKDNLISIVLIIAITITSSLLWARFVKQYVDHRFQEIEKEED